MSRTASAPRCRSSSTAAGGGVLVDVDGNSLIDLGSGIAVTNGRQRRARGGAAGAASRSAAFTHTCFMVTPYDGYVDVCEALAELTPGDHAKKSALFNSGAEAVENAVKIARSATGRDAVVVFDHAYHGRTNLTMAMTAKNMPYKHGFGPFAGEVYRAPMSYPFRDGLSGDRRPRPGPSTCSTSRSAPSNLACDRDRADPGRGRLRRAGRGLPARARGVGPGQRRSSSSPTRSSPASAAPATGSPATTRASSPTWSPPPRASPAACRWPRVTGRADLMDAVHAGGLGGTYGGNPVACAAALGSIEEMQEHDLGGPGPRHRGAHARPA